MANEVLTPMMVQYNKIKANNMDKVLFYRLGDFYEMFDEDAIEVSRLLNLTLTHRGKTPMCGIPYHASTVYIKRLLDEGKKIAICEQTEDPSKTKKLVNRAVVQIISPATVVEDDFLNSKENSYIISISYSIKETHVAYSDITSGEFSLKTFEKDSSFQQLASFLTQLRAKEILVNEDDYFIHREYAALLDDTQTMVTKLPSNDYSLKKGFKLLTSHLEIQNLRMFSIEDKNKCIGAAGALLKYIKDSSKSSLSQITSYSLESDNSYLKIDAATRKSLEILNNTQDGGQSNTLYSTIDQTITSGGARLLKKWLSYPLVDEQILNNRLDWVSYLKENRAERDRVRKQLKNVLDMTRLTTRITMNCNKPSDLLAISRTANAFVNIVSDDWQRYSALVNDKESIKNVELKIENYSSIEDNTMNEILSLVSIIQKAIKEESLGPFQEGCVIKDGYDNELDELRAIKYDGNRLLHDFVNKVKDETGIPQIKLGNNKILGHFLEIRKAHIDKVPNTFYRKQTLVNAERFTNEELGELETKILKSSINSERREKVVYNEIIEQAKGISESLLALSKALSRIDVLQSFATISENMNYCRPEFTNVDSIQVKEGRHPVVEKQQGLGLFVPNDLELTNNGKRFCLITGPNMAGKSTYLRQSALIILLSQIGCFVPANNCKLSLCDKLFCRVGASDNIAKGESTFMVEMQEASHILRTATEKSFVIMDEIGRGTSTQDGMSLAHSFMKHLVKVRAKTLFATHYHELTMLDVSDVRLMTLAVEERGKDIIFVRKVKDGVANSSYGLHVAKLAGVPKEILKEANKFQKTHFGEYTIGNMDMDLFSLSQLDEIENEAEDNSIDYNSILSELKEFNLSISTPLQTMVFIQKLKDEIEERESQ
ncbi:MAG: DNA mismatch repair protein MutS [Spirochaetaceae bacterium]|nr:DNA mismatch repair protein MutS [Spirochaetaceae bacterium]